MKVPSPSFRTPGSELRTPSSDFQASINIEVMLVESFKGKGLEVNEYNGRRKTLVIQTKHISR